MKTEQISDKLQKALNAPKPSTPAVHKNPDHIILVLPKRRPGRLP